MRFSESKRRKRKLQKGNPLQYHPYGIPEIRVARESAIQGQHDNHDEMQTSPVPDIVSAPRMSIELQPATVEDDTPEMRYKLWRESGKLEYTKTGELPSFIRARLLREGAELGYDNTQLMDIEREIDSIGERIRQVREERGDQVAAAYIAWQVFGHRRYQSGQNSLIRLIAEQSGNCSSAAYAVCAFAEAAGFSDDEIQMKEYKDHVQGVVRFGDEWVTIDYTPKACDPREPGTRILSWKGVKKKELGIRLSAEDIVYDGSHVEPASVTESGGIQGIVQWIMRSLDEWDDKEFYSGKRKHAISGTNGLGKTGLKKSYMMSGLFSQIGSYIPSKKWLIPPLALLGATYLSDIPSEVERRVAEAEEQIQQANSSNAEGVSDMELLSIVKDVVQEEYQEAAEMAEQLVEEVVETLEEAGIALPHSDSEDEGEGKEKDDFLNGTVSQTWTNTQDVESAKMELTDIYNLSDEQLDRAFAAIEARNAEIYDASDFILAHTVSPYAGPLTTLAGILDGSIAYDLEPVNGTYSFGSAENGDTHTFTIFEDGASEITIDLTGEKRVSDSFFKYVIRDTLNNHEILPENPVVVDIHINGDDLVVTREQVARAHAAVLQEKNRQQQDKRGHQIGYTVIWVNGVKMFTVGLESIQDGMAEAIDAYARTVIKSTSIDLRDFYFADDAYDYEQQAFIKAFNEYSEGQLINLVVNQDQYIPEEFFTNPNISLSVHGGLPIEENIGNATIRNLKVHGIEGLGTDDSLDFIDWYNASEYEGTHTGNDVYLATVPGATVSSWNVFESIEHGKEVTIVSAIDPTKEHISTIDIEDSSVLEGTVVNIAGFDLQNIGAVDASDLRVQALTGDKIEGSPFSGIIVTVFSIEADTITETAFKTTDGELTILNDQVDTLVLSTNGLEGNVFAGAEQLNIAFLQNGEATTAYAQLASGTFRTVLLANYSELPKLAEVYPAIKDTVSRLVVYEDVGRPLGKDYDDSIFEGRIEYEDYSQDNLRIYNDDLLATILESMHQEVDITLQEPTNSTDYAEDKFGNVLATDPVDEYGENEDPRTFSDEFSKKVQREMNQNQESESVAVPIDPSSLPQIDDLDLEGGMK